MGYIKTDEEIDEYKREVEDFLKEGFFVVGVDEVSSDV